MEIKTNFIDFYTKRVDKLLIQCQTHKSVVYVLIALILLLIFVFVFSFFLK
jgi:hypothetical protein